MMKPARTEIPWDDISVEGCSIVGAIAGAGNDASDWINSTSVRVLLVRVTVAVAPVRRESRPLGVSPALYCGSAVGILSSVVAPVVRCPRPCFGRVILNQSLTDHCRRRTSHTAVVMPPEMIKTGKYQRLL